MAQRLPVIVIKRHTEMARDGVEVDGCVGRTTNRGVDDDRVLKPSDRQALLALPPASLTPSLAPGPTATLLSLRPPPPIPTSLLVLLPRSLWAVRRLQPNPTARQYRFGLVLVPSDEKAGPQSMH